MLGEFAGYERLKKPLKVCNVFYVTAFRFVSVFSFQIFIFNATRQLSRIEATPLRFVNKHRIYNLMRLKIVRFVK